MSRSQNYLGHYRLIRLIRSGRRCNVWEAQNEKDNERVACKVVLEDFRTDKEEIEQLKNEATVGKTMDSPHVIRVFDFVNHRTPFIAMQLFNAKNLKQEIRERPDVVAVNIPDYIHKCAKGLEHMHIKGWLHCDIKPDNYLVDEQGTVKLIDFSIAKPMKQKRKLFGRNAVQGTMSYMSPEQIRGKPLDQTVDVYGFGCLVHELFSGKPPFTGVNADDLLRKHLRSSPPSLQALNRSVSDKMAALVLRLLAKDQKKRPQTFTEVIKELEKLTVYRAGMRPTLNENV